MVDLLGRDRNDFEVGGTLSERKLCLSTRISYYWESGAGVASTVELTSSSMVDRRGSGIFGKQ